ncbi:MAG: trypsin-like peptidase domain-containing protein [Candidatus Kaiserbacteria bacterium]|nr:trypsin-like peptidase domain-containing protein [Candidatus Kaiserbacteria bacterium]
MNRSTPYLGIIAMLAAVFFIAMLSDAPPTPQKSSVGTTTPIVVVSEPEVVSPSKPEATTTSPVAKPPAVSHIEKTVAPKVPEVVPAHPVTAPVTPPAPTEEMFDASALALRDALVNIICYAPQGSGLHSISGSGVFIDSKGIILTNAHIAQSFLLSDHGVFCVVRSGSPARDKYEAALIHISSPWIRANAATLTQDAPTGNGEYDFALLAVTKSVTSAPLPSQFPFVPLAQTPPLSGAPVTIASYGAQFLEASQVRSALFPTIVFGSIKKVFTFATNTVDVFSLGGSAAAQEGSSGGGISDTTGTLIGTITTSTVTGPTDTRTLSAITASYIRAEYANETGKALDLLLAAPTVTSISGFVPQIATLEALLVAHLP